MKIRRRGVAAAGVAVALVVALVLVVDPFGSSTPASSIDNAAPTATARIQRESIDAQTQVDATLGYADAGTIAVPAGTAPSALEQAVQAAAQADATLAGARATLAIDAQALVQAQSALAADRAKRAVDCDGDGAATGASTSPCAADAQAVAADEANVSAGAAKAAADRRTVATAQSADEAAQQSFATARASAAVYGQTSSYTSLPSVGAVVRRGGTLYGVDGRPAVLLYGPTPAWRSFAAAMAPGPDVAELNLNLRVLGFGAPHGDAFTSATASAVARFQAAHHLAQTGELALGSVVFEQGAVRITSVTPTLGAAVQPGPVLAVTSLRRVVSIALDAAQQSQVKVGDPVVITLPDNRTTPGRITHVGSVATTPSGSDQSGGSSTPTIEVDVTPTDPAATGRLDQAPVFVSITTASVRNALVVPVGALLALAGGGYALELVAQDGSHRLAAVELGLFDDGKGVVQVTGAGIAAGQKIVVPA
ncbi:MAG: peptidoglycan-binding domain-containing protein [Actinomycetota bacterium]